MQKTALYILYWPLLIGVISIVYFYALIFGLPFISVPILTAIMIWPYYTLKAINTDDKPLSLVTFSLVLLAISLMGQKIVLLSEKHGVWDTWAMWNMHAKYLMDGDNWTTLFKNTEAAHTDYPLLLPANITFFSKLSGNMVISSYAFHLIITILIPVLIFVQTQSKNILFAAIGLFWLSTNDYFLGIAAYQLADNLIGFLLLCAIVCIDNVATDKRYIIFATAILGLCMWTKNEGVMIAILFVLFYYKPLLQKEHIRYSIAGIGLPLITLLVFKICYAPSNDIVAGQGSNTLHKLLSLQRYDIVFTALMKFVLDNYYALTCLVALHILIRIVTKRMPDKRVLFLLALCACYCMVYIITPQDLGWHLFTSQNRLLHQLIPATTYALIMVYADTINFRFRTAFASNP
jgi:hypothetical protein